jgi:hypothetical protein
MCSVCADRAYGPFEPRGSDMVGVGGHPPPGWLINSFPMYLDKIRSVRVTDVRRSGMSRGTRRASHSVAIRDELFTS